MKKIVASVSLVAVGASGLQAALLPGLTAESGKPFTLSSTLRGFYDDNINTYPNDSALPPGAHRTSFGFEVSPSVEFSFPMEQTTLSFGYVYSYKYYMNQLLGSSGHDDNTHDFHAAMTHAFSERYSVSVSDSFVIGQEPDFLRAGNSFTTFQRYSGNNLRNYGTVDFSAQLTPEFGLDLGYANTLVSYSDNANPATTGTASNSGLLDSIDHLVHLDGRYQIEPQTIGVLGAQFRETDYTGYQPIGVYNTGQPVMSGNRNARSYYGYVGLDHNFRPDLTGSIRAGGRYTDYYNALVSQNEGSPYVMSSLRYTYLPESYVSFGSSYDYSPSSLGPGVNSSDQINVSAQSGTVFATLNHRIMPKLYGNLQAQYQNTKYYGGLYDNKTANFYLVGLNLRYQFTPNFSTEVGYNYDNLNSDVQGQGSYDRNRVYVGITGSY
jgi:Putative beta-barrel porin 2